jgi:hypothetical protein
MEERIYRYNLGEEYLSETDRLLIVEINMVRTDPAEYARSFLVPIRRYFNNSNYSAVSKAICQRQILLERAHDGVNH